MSAAIDDATLAASQLCFVLFALIAYGLDGFAHAAESLVGAAIGRRDLPGSRRRSGILGLATIMAVLAAHGGCFRVAVICVHDKP